MKKSISKQEKGLQQWLIPNCYRNTLVFIIVGKSGLLMLLFYCGALLGDALIVEESFISTIFGLVHGEVCNFCFKYCISLIPCTKCGDVSDFFLYLSAKS